MKNNVFFLAFKNREVRLLKFFLNLNFCKLELKKKHICFRIANYLSIDDQYCGKSFFIDVV